MGAGRGARREERGAGSRGSRRVSEHRVLETAKAREVRPPESSGDASSVLGPARARDWRRSRLARGPLCGSPSLCNSQRTLPQVASARGGAPCLDRGPRRGVMPQSEAASARPSAEAVGRSRADSHAVRRRGRRRNREGWGVFRRQVPSPEIDPQVRELDGQVGFAIQTSGTRSVAREPHRRDPTRLPRTTGTSRADVRRFPVELNAWRAVQPLRRMEASAGAFDQGRARQAPPPRASPRRIPMAQRAT